MTASPIPLLGQLHVRSIRLNIFPISIGAFIQFPLGDFLHTITEIVVHLHYPPPQVVALEVPTVEEGGHGEGRRPE